MKILTMHQTMQELAKATGKWAMYISFQAERLGSYERICQAAPYLNIDDHYQILDDGCAILLFDTEEECYSAFNQTVGDDGPTETNPYNGEERVYALTCDPNGDLHKENT